MGCDQDPVLVTAGIFVDYFTNKDKDIRFFFLTHAHKDHMNGLNKNFKRKNGRIVCTLTTRNLVKIMIPSLKNNDFILIKPGKVLQINDNIICHTFKAYHCDGSVMLSFVVRMKKHRFQRIFYTGDFRFNPEMNKDPLLTECSIDKFYYDDTFEAITETWPTYTKTLKDLSEHLKAKDYMPYVHATVLGIEQILRQLSKNSGVKIKLTQGMVGTSRGTQLRYLLRSNICNSINCKKVHITLGNHNADDSDYITWVIPTATKFLCKGSRRKPNKKKHYIFFSTHPNKKELDLLKLIIHPKHCNPCKNKIIPSEMSCNI